MRILQHHHRVRLEEGGTIRSALDLTAAMASRGHESALLTFDDTHAPEAWRSAGSAAPEAGRPAVIRVEAPALPGGFLARRQRAALEARLREVDVVHLHGMWIPSAAQVAAACRRVGVPYLVTLHGMLDDWSMRQKPVRKRVYLALQGNAYLRHAAAVHVTSQAELEQAQRWLPRSTGRVIPLLVELDAFRDPPPADRARACLGIDDDGVPLVLFVGRLHPQKRAEVVIDAVARLRSRGTDARLALVGPGDEAYLESLRARAAAAGIGDRFVLPGLVDGADKASLYAFAAVFALPSEQESFGLVIIEAMACGTAAVCTRGIDLWRELESSGGAVVTESTPDAFADAIGTLLADSSRRTDMATKGRAWVEKTLDPDRIAGQFEALYQEVVG